MKSDQYILLTIDVEDWFQVENFKPWIPFSTWDERELRVEKNTHRLLDLFDAIGLKAPNQAVGYELSALSYEKSHPKATFFILGWIAERLPNLIREIHARGHEVASHGCDHRLPNSLSARDLKKDLVASKKRLEDTTGAEVFGFRAPSFAISDAVLENIGECGYRYDSSYNSFSLHNRYGKIALNGRGKNGIAHRVGERLYELPISNLNLWNPIRYLLPAYNSKRQDRNPFILPWGGGAYFRIIPFSAFKFGVRSILKKDNAYLLYLHPWEIDVDQPRVEDVSASFKFRHYVNLGKTTNKLVKLLNNFSSCDFITCSHYIAETT